MVKAPVPGRVKTRLSPPLSHDEAAGLYRAFLVDIFGSIASIEDVDHYIFHAPFESAGDEETLIDIIPQEMALLAQEGSDLGERMKSVFHRLLKTHDKAAIIGSDSPDLPVHYIEASYGILDSIEGGVVLGPAEDGGYYLIAMNKPLVTPFENMEWSTVTVLQDTIDRCTAADVEVRLLPRWYDVDTIDDVRKVREAGRATETCRFIEASLSHHL